MDLKDLDDIQEVKAKDTTATKALNKSQNWFLRTVGSCPICDETHLFKSRKTSEQLITAMLHLCPIYEMATVKVWLSIITENKACILCTDHRHTEANCTWTTSKPCNVRGCYERHHPSLHQTVTGRINVIKGQDLTLTGLLPVMICTFKEQKKITTILFDSGSTVSLIQRSFVSSLFLKGFPLMTTFYKACE